MIFLIDNTHLTAPAINLAMEEYLLRQLDITHDYFLLYLNQPCIIIGRHQNIFEEVNYPLLRKRGIPVFRRISGGGAVYHDPGNLNFSFITQYQKFKFNNYRLFNNPILQALQSLGLKAEFNGRNDIVIEQKKFSGNAQFTTKDRMISHGTLLFSAQLAEIPSLLQPSVSGYTSSAIKSVRSQVVNISELLDPSLNFRKFKDLIIHSVFSNQPDIPEYRLSASDWRQIQSLAKQKYQSWEWNFGESPDFTFQNVLSSAAGKQAVVLKIKKCRLVNIDLEGSLLPRKLQIKIPHMLLGVRYSPEYILAALEDLSLSHRQKRLIETLFLGDL
jgi:lipoate-protein ligase A